MKCLWIVLLLAAALPASGWQLMPVGTPEVPSLVSDSTGQHLWLSTGSAGLWTSNNGGQSWEPVSTRLRPGGHISVWGLIALDPGADTLVVEATPPRYSFNGGQTWQTISHPAVRSGGGYLSISPHRHSLWLYSTSLEVLRSTDYGQQWSQVSPWSGEPGYIGPVVPDPQFPGLLWLCTSDFDEADGNFSVLFRSTDDGLTWSAALDLPAVNTVWGAAAIHVLRASNGDLLTAVYSYADTTVVQRLLRSTDDGADWQVVESFSGAVARRIIEDVQQPGRLLAAGRPQYYLSTDYGATWAARTLGIPGTEHSATWRCWQNPHTGRFYISLYGRGLFQSADGGETWTSHSLPPVGVPSRLRHVFLPASNLLWLGVDDFDHRCWFLRAPNPDWQVVTLPDTLAGLPLIPDQPFYQAQDSLVALVYSLEEQTSRVVRSFDGGATWSLGSSLDSWVLDIHVHSQPEATRLLARSWHELKLSTDLGETWTQSFAVTDDGWGITDVALDDNWIVILLDDLRDSRVYRSSNGGQIWEELPGPHPYFRSVHLAGETIVLQPVISRECWLWRNGAWEVTAELPFGDHIRSWSLAVVSGPEPLLVAARYDSTALWISRDWGNTWEYRYYALSAYDAQNSGAQALAYDPYRQRLWMSSSLGPCYVTLDQLLAADDPLILQPSSFSLSAYPNPFNSSTVLRFSLPRRGPAELALYDLLGRRVAVLAAGVQEAGAHAVRWDAPAQASGVYFARLTSGAEQRTAKLLLLR